MAVGREEAVRSKLRRRWNFVLSRSPSLLARALSDRFFDNMYETLRSESRVVAATEPRPGKSDGEQAGQDAEDGAGLGKEPTAACDSCSVAAAKYRCPACGARSCSVDCVKAHKAATGCSGARNAAAFVVREEMDNNTLMNGEPGSFRALVSWFWV
jgi:hypothetical protein